MEQQEKPSKELNVLIIDDDPIFSLILNTSFNRIDTKCNCETIDNVDGAIEYLKSCIENGREVPSLLIVDMNMPDKGGIEFIEEYEKTIDVDSNFHFLYLLSSGMSPDEETRALSFSSVTGIESKSNILDFVKKINQKHFVTNKSYA